MNWKKITDKKNPRSEIPKDGNSFLVLWKGQICLLQYDSDLDKFWGCVEPYVTRKVWLLDEENELKISYWIPLKKPDGY